MEVLDNVKEPRVANDGCIMITSGIWVGRAVGGGGWLRLGRELCLSIPCIWLSRHPTRGGILPRKTLNYSVIGCQGVNRSKSSTDFEGTGNSVGAGLTLGSR